MKLRFAAIESFLTMSCALALSAISGTAWADGFIQVGEKSVFRYNNAFLLRVEDMESCLQGAATGSSQMQKLLLAAAGSEGDDVRVTYAEFRKWDDIVGSVLYPDAGEHRLPLNEKFPPNTFWKDQLRERDYFAVNSVGAPLTCEGMSLPEFVLPSPDQEKVSLEILNAQAFRTSGAIFDVRLLPEHNRVYRYTDTEPESSTTVGCVQLYGRLASMPFTARMMMDGLAATYSSDISDQVVWQGFLLDREKQEVSGLDFQVNVAGAHVFLLTIAHPETLPPSAKDQRTICSDLLELMQLPASEIDLMSLTDRPEVSAAKYQRRDPLVCETLLFGATYRFTFGFESTKTSDLPAVALDDIVNCIGSHLETIKEGRRLDVFIQGFASGNSDSGANALNEFSFGRSEALRTALEMRLGDIEDKPVQLLSLAGGGFNTTAVTSFSMNRAALLHIVERSVPPEDATPALNLIDLTSHRPFDSCVVGRKKPMFVQFETLSVQPDLDRQNRLQSLFRGTAGQQLLLVTYDSEAIQSEPPETATEATESVQTQNVLQPFADPLADRILKLAASPPNPVVEEASTICVAKAERTSRIRYLYQNRSGSALDQEGEFFVPAQAIRWRFASYPRSPEVTAGRFADWDVRFDGQLVTEQIMQLRAREEVTLNIHGAYDSVTLIDQMAEDGSGFGYVMLDAGRE